MSRPSRPVLTLTALVAIVLGMAPTVGDVGACGSEPQELSTVLFVAERKNTDCTRCTECGLDTARCRRACTGGIPGDTSIPSTCRPLVHDGEVCLHALEAASCDTFARYVDDDAPTTPSECEFCRFESTDGG